MTSSLTLAALVSGSASLSLSSKKRALLAAANATSKPPIPPLSTSLALSCNAWGASLLMRPSAIFRRSSYLAGLLPPFPAKISKLDLQEFKVEYERIAEDPEYLEVILQVV